VAATLDSHHVVPLCYGGKKDGLQVRICGTCHKEIHHYEVDQREPPLHLKRFVAVVREAKRAFESGLTVAKDSRRQLTAKLSEADEQLLDALAAKFNTRGRPATISVLIRYAARQLGLIR
jgi:hypothetical protein